MNLSQPVLVVPILPDRSPAASQWAEQVSLDHASGEVRFVLRNVAALPTRYLLVGAEFAPREPRFATLETLEVVSTAEGLRVRGHFLGEDQDLMNRENLEPVFRTEAGRFCTRLPEEILSKWVGCGVLHPVVLDRVLLCPSCGGLASFRNGCRSCGSMHLLSDLMIHHFACAHVGKVQDFEHPDGLICPKCRTRNLIVGADFEHLPGPFQCLDCGWSDMELELVGRCLACHVRFPGNQALEEDLVGYHVHRLDPLALVNAA